MGTGDINVASVNLNDTDVSKIVRGKMTERIVDMSVLP